FVTGLGAMLAAPLWPRPEQAAARVPRIGTLWPAPASSPTVVRVTEAFKQGLEQDGYVEGKTVTVEFRYAEQEQMLRAANDLVGLNLDIIVTGGTPGSMGVSLPVATFLPLACLISRVTLTRPLVLAIPHRTN